jgi:hypothetical protein
MAAGIRWRPSDAREPCQGRARPLSGAPLQAAIAQSVEHIIRNDGVGGSNPSCGTIEIASLFWNTAKLSAKFRKLPLGGTTRRQQSQWFAVKFPVRPNREANSP